MPPSLATFYIEANETNAQLFADVAGLDGIGLGFIAYGVHLTLYFTCISLFWDERKRDDRRTWPWITYMTVLFIIGSISAGLNMSMVKIIFLDNRNYPGGPAAFATQILSLPNLVCAACAVIGSWLADGLLILRFYMIIGPKRWIMFPLCGLFITSMVFSVACLREYSSPGSVSWVRERTSLAVIYWSTSVAINAIVTIGIVAVLLRMRRTIRQVVGSDHNVPYVSISAMLIESAFLYSAVVLAFLIPLAMNSAASLLFFHALEQVQFIAPLLIMTRVAKGRAFTRQKLEDSIQLSCARSASTLRFDGRRSDTASVRQFEASIAPNSEITLFWPEQGPQESTSLHGH